MPAATPPSVLVVDDSAVMRAMVRRTLLAGGLGAARVHEAPDGQAALDLLSTEPVDVVVTDLNMPTMGGEEMIARLREHPLTAALPVVVVSTERSQTRIAALRACGVAFLNKPFTPAALAAEILRLTGTTDADLAAAAADHGDDFDF